MHIRWKRTTRQLNSLRPPTSFRLASFNHTDCLLFWVENKLCALTSSPHPTSSCLLVLVVVDGWSVFFRTQPYISHGGEGCSFPVTLWVRKALRYGISLVEFPPHFPHQEPLYVALLSYLGTGINTVHLYQPTNQLPELVFCWTNKAQQ